MKTDNQISQTMLVIEDDDSNYMLIQEHLSLYNVNIIRCDKSSDILDLIEKQNKIDLVLIVVYSINSPYFDTIKAIKKHKSDVPIIMHASPALLSHKDKFANCECDAIISHTFAADDFCNIVNKYLKLF